MWPQQTLCHHGEEKKGFETRCTVGSQACDLRSLTRHTHTSWNQTDSHCGVGRSCVDVKIKVIDRLPLLYIHLSFTWSGTCSGSLHTHLQTHFKASVFINTLTHTCMQLFVARPTLKSALLSHSLSHVHMQRKMHTGSTQPYISPTLILAWWSRRQSQSVSCHVNQCVLGHKSFGRQKDWLLLTTPWVNHGHALLTYHYKPTKTDAQQETNWQQDTERANNKRLYKKTKQL